MPIVAQSLNFNSHTAQTDIMNLPTSGGCSSWDLLFEYTITDGGITADENIGGSIKKILIKDGSDAQAVFHVERDELGKVGSWLASRVGKQGTADVNSSSKWGIDSGEYFIDDTPTTAQKQFGFYRFNQQINFDSLKNPQLEVQLDVSQEFASASAFSGTFKFAYTPATVSKTESLGRTFTSSETRSEIDLGDYPVIDLMWATDDTAAGNTEASQLQGSDGGYDIDANEPMEMMHYAANFQDSGRGSFDDVTQTFVSGPILSEPHSKRKLVVRSATAAVITAHYISVSKVVAHDEARSKAGPAARFGQKKVSAVLATNKSKLSSLPARRMRNILKGMKFGGGYR